VQSAVSHLLISALLQAPQVPPQEAVVGPVETIAEMDAVEVTLRGSPESMARQHAVAVAGGYTFVGTLEEMELLAEQGQLVRVDGGEHYEVMEWVFPYALPEVRTFVERLAWEYRQACGEALVVTSLTRPFSEQPRNAHQLSVHPAGMAVDLRIPQNPECREYVESRLLEKEEAGLLDITREVAPPHYHVAIFPGPYMAWESAQPPVPVARERVEPAAAEHDATLPFALIGLLALVVLATLLAGWLKLRRVDAQDEGGVSDESPPGHEGEAEYPEEGNRRRYG
jgi:hypothetical protein